MDILASIDLFLRSDCDAAGAAAAVSQQTGLSAARLNELSKEQAGLPFQSLVQQRRLHLAQELICQTPLPFSDIALRCGFYDHSHLCRTLSRHVGCSPSRLRQGAAAR